MPIYLWSAGFDVDKGKAIEHRLRKVLPDLTVISSIDDVCSSPKITSSQTYVLVVAPSNDRRAFTELIDFALRGREQFFTILISDDISLDDYKALTRTGGADWVSTTADPQEILDIILRRNARTVAEAKLAGPPRERPLQSPSCRVREALETLHSPWRPASISKPIKRLAIATFA